MTPHRLIGALWLAFVAVWFISAWFAKRTRRRAPWRTWIIRLAIIAAIVAADLRFAPGGDVLATAPLPWQWAGALLCALGFGFAVWARVHLGRNWGMPMSLREGHELVTTGPYALVRHPIYTGILLAMLGSAFAVPFAWIPAFALFCAYFVYSALTEERMMSEQFPEQYPAYKARTRMLIPFIL